MSNKTELEAIETMKHWVKYERENKDKIKYADELIEIQEKVLNKASRYDSLVKKIKKLISKLEKEAEEKGDDWGYISCRIQILNELLKI